MGQETVTELDLHDSGEMAETEISLVVPGIRAIGTVGEGTVSQGMVERAAEETEIGRGAEIENGTETEIENGREKETETKTERGAERMPPKRKLSGGERRSPLCVSCPLKRDRDRQREGHKGIPSVTIE